MRPRVGQLVESRLQREFDFWDMDPDPFHVDSDRADDFASQTLNALGVDNLVLYPYMRQATDEPETLHFKSDRHWTKAGHQVTSDAIFEKLNDLAR